MSCCKAHFPRDVGRGKRCHVSLLLGHSPRRLSARARVMAAQGLQDVPESKDFSFPAEVRAAAGRLAAPRARRHKP